MIRWKHLPILLSALLCTASCDLGTSPGGGGTEGEGISGRLQDPSGRPIAGVLVRVFPDARTLSKASGTAEAIFDSVYSDSRGFFRFDSLPTGSYGLRTYARRGDTTLVLLMRRILYGGGRKSLGTQTLVVGGKLVMKVMTGPIAQDPGPRPPGNTLCEIVDLPFSVEADASGLCELDALPPGQYAVRLSRPGFDVYVTAPIEVRPGQSAGLGPWSLHPSDTAAPPRYSRRASTLAHWTFDTLAAGKFADLGERAIALYPEGAVPLVISPHGKAALFNGTSTLSTGGIVPELTGRAARYITIEARVRLSQYPSASNRDSASAVLGTVWGYTLLVRSNGALAVASPADGGSHWNIAAAWSQAGVVPLNQWVDLAVSIDKSTLQAYGFINGVAIQLRNGNAVIPNSPEAVQPFYVGGVPGTDRPFIGQIDEARVSDTLVLGQGLPMARSDSLPSYTRTFSYAVADAEIYSSVPGSPDHRNLSDLNGGGSDVLGVGAEDTLNVFRSLVRFSLPTGIQPGQINRAVIRMHVRLWSASGPGGTRVDVHRVLKSWTEGNGKRTANSAALNGVTARQRSWAEGVANDWNQVLVGLDGVDASAAPTATDSLPGGSMTAWEWDVTELARQWAADTTKNFGVLLTSALPKRIGPRPPHPAFHSRETPAADSLKPTLIINGAATLRPTQPAPTQAVDSTLVGHWDFEENFNSTVRDVAGGQNGVLVGAASAWDGAVGNGSFQLNGANYVKIPASPRFARLKDFTLSAWVWQDDQSQDEPVLEFSHPDTLGVHLWVNTRGDQTRIPGQLYASTMTKTQEWGHLTGTPGLLAPGRWNRVAYTYSASTRTMRLYANGVLVAQATLGGASEPWLGGDLYLGHRPVDSKVARQGAGLRGRLDDVKIWSRALTGSELM